MIDTASVPLAVDTGVVVIVVAIAIVLVVLFVTLAMRGRQRRGAQARHEVKETREGEGRRR
jgi:heme/copper-type cytochrome/quinol oxidase subunit 2